MKTVFITGANSGIGWNAAQKLVKRGHRVVAATRSVENGHAAVEQLEKFGEAKFLKLDLANEESVRTCVKEFKETGLPLDCLVLNAGVMEAKLKRAPNDAELTIATNHLGHFLLANLLVPIMKPGSRIVIVSSSLHNKDSRGGPQLDLDDFDAHKDPDNFNGMTQYRTSKLLNVLFFKQLSQQLADSGITVACMNPGWIRATNLGRNAGFFANLAATVVSMFVSKTVVRTVDQGGDVIVALSVDEQYLDKTGVYYDCLVNPVQPNPVAEDEQLQIDAWNVSCDWVHLPEKKLALKK